MPRATTPVKQDELKLFGAIISSVPTADNADTIKEQLATWTNMIQAKVLICSKQTIRKILDNASRAIMYMIKYYTLIFDINTFYNIIEIELNNQSNYQDGKSSMNDIFDLVCNQIKIDSYFKIVHIYRQNYENYNSVISHQAIINWCLVLIKLTKPEHLDKMYITNYGSSDCYCDGVLLSIYLYYFNYMITNNMQLQLIDTPNTYECFVKMALEQKHYIDFVDSTNAYSHGVHTNIKVDFQHLNNIYRKLFVPACIDNHIILKYMLINNVSIANQNVHKNVTINNLYLQYALHGIIDKLFQVVPTRNKTTEKVDTILSKSNIQWLLSLKLQFAPNTFDNFIMLFKRRFDVHKKYYFMFHYNSKISDNELLAIVLGHIEVGLQSLYELMVENGVALDEKFMLGTIELGSIFKNTKKYDYVLSANLYHILHKNNIDCVAYTFDKVDPNVIAFRKAFSQPLPKSKKILQTEPEYVKNVINQYKLRTHRFCLENAYFYGVKVGNLDRYKYLIECHCEPNRRIIEHMINNDNYVKDHIVSRLMETVENFDANSYELMSVPYKNFAII